MNQYIIGGLVTITARFYNTDGALADPTEVTAEVMLPDESLIDLSVEKVSTGLYRTTYAPLALGLFYYRFAGTGEIQAANEGYFYAQSVFPLPASGGIILTDESGNPLTDDSGNVLTN